MNGSGCSVGCVRRPQERLIVAATNDLAPWVDAEGATNVVLSLLNGGADESQIGEVKDGGSKGWRRREGDAQPYTKIDPSASQSDTPPLRSVQWYHRAR